MSDGTWDGHDWFERSDEKMALYAALALADGVEPDLDRVHWSPCDEGCNHGGPGREMLRDCDWWSPTDDVGPPQPGKVIVEASWRSVDVRTLGWPMDLRPEKLSVLCLRCFAGHSQKDSPA